jgi:hypothetical protein
MIYTLHVVYQYSLKQSFICGTFYTFAILLCYRLAGFIVLWYINVTFHTYLTNISLPKKCTVTLFVNHFFLFDLDN